MSDENHLSLIETECPVIVELLREHWMDSQRMNEWKRIAFQLNGAALVSRKGNAALADELDFLCSLALNRVYILEALEMKAAIEERNNQQRR